MEAVKVKGKLYMLITKLFNIWNKSIYPLSYHTPHDSQNHEWLSQPSVPLIVQPNCVVQLSKRAFIKKSHAFVKKVPYFIPSSSIQEDFSEDIVTWTIGPISASKEMQEEMGSRSRCTKLQVWSTEGRQQGAGGQGQAWHWS